MKSQKGMTTLLITSMLLIVALLFSLASYKNLFYQIKRTQNEVVARQSHWLAEGGLECGFATIREEKDITTDLSSCVDVFGNNLDSLTLDSTISPAELSSKKMGVNLSKNISANGGGSYGVIKSSADLYFKGDHEYYADPNYKLSDNSWACLVLRYKNTFYINNDSTSFFTNKGLETGSEECNESYITNTKQLPVIYNSDIKLDDTMDVFKETFNEERINWEEVKFSEVFVQFDVIDPNNCATEIKNKITTEKRYIWVTGNCFLEQATGLDELSEESQKGDGIFLLIENGLLSVNGASSTFKGIIYHFINNYSPIESGTNQWSISTYGMWTYVSNLTMYKPKGITLTPTQQEEMRDKLVFFMNGSFVPSGGYIFDTPDKLAYFNMSSDLSYDGTLIDNLLSEFNIPTWVQGSWNDL
ncbi:hypothetical protein VAS14_07099 [Vibrio angustum S14]|uniref:Uncharacterized protein n=1 Tax=Photobacterium angustum (strain S14 / CCUG 15956) TaxID=314292 RepID=Q1ZK05_PHOAS|nr:hypothetical protein [Photobacterium angustum]EAS62462.1 hypothetical protein VAS14_07099 [Vibrio angustum S14] [Photobacterium angustum S14]